MLAGTVDRELPVVMFAGNVAFGIFLVVALVLERQIARRGEVTLDLRWIWASAGSLLLAFAVWNTAKDGSPLCFPTSVYQGHGVWHLLCALAAWCLFRFWAASEQLTAVRNERVSVGRCRRLDGTASRLRGTEPRDRRSRPPQVHRHADPTATSVDRAVAALPVRRPQVLLEDLAGRVAGQRLDDVDGLRALEVRRACSRQKAMISSSVAEVSGLRATTALTDSPQVSSGTPMIAHSMTAGCSARTRSTSGE